MANDIAMSRWQMAYRTPIFYVALFALSYGSFVLLQKPRERLIGAIESTEQTSMVYPDQHLISVVSTNAQPKVAAMLVDSKGSSAAANVPTANSAAEEQVSAPSVPHPAEAQTFRDKLAKAASSQFETNPSARGVAIVQLGALPVEQAVPALRTALQDEVASNRELAVRSMVRLARRYGDDNGVIRGALQEATTTSDVTVAQMAQSALVQVSAAIQHR